MSTNYFPDGFPTTPIEAVNFCEFLTEQEKNEWLGWINNADENQKSELVETLHAIYAEQKGNEQPKSQPAPVETAPFIPKNAPATEIPNKIPASLPIANFDESTFLSDAQALKVPTATIPVNQSKTEKPTLKSSKDMEIPGFVEPKTMEEHIKKAETMLLSAKEVGQLYEKFLSARNQSYNSNEDFQDKQAKLFNKIMEMVQEAAVLSDKVLKLNYDSVDNAKSIQELKNATQVKGGTSLQYQINALREEMKKTERNIEYSIERIDREFEEFREDITQRMDEMNSQVVAALADNYKADGIQEKVAKMQAKIEIKIDDLENKMMKNGFLSSRNNDQSNLDKLKKNIPSPAPKDTESKKSRSSQSESTDDYDSYFSNKAKSNEPSLSDVVKVAKKL
jgi:hypothetical protein